MPLLELPTVISLMGILPEVSRGIYTHKYICPLIQRSFDMDEPYIREILLCAVFFNLPFNVSSPL